MRRNILLIIVIILNIWLCLIILSNRNISETVTTRNLSSGCNEDEITEGFLNTIKYEHMAFQISGNANNIFDEIFSIDSSKKLFYRLDFPYCGNCIYPVIEKLSDTPELLKNNIIILSAFPSEKFAADFNGFMKDKNLTVINIPDLEFFFDSKHFIGAYMFLMDSNLNQERMFFTNQCNQFMLDEYLRFIKQFMER
jgi:hypothetical protein